jgi:hypothetical protein
MNRNYLLIKKSILILFVFLLYGCKKTEVNDEYYVKYEVESSTVYYGGKLDVQLKSESSSTLPLVINQREKWETTIGPVKKGFIASLKVVKQGWNGQTSETQLKLYLRIHVSKNNGPFALKQLNGSDTPRAIAETQITVE